MKKPVNAPATPSVLSRWPLVWRLIAVVTGVLPLSGVIRGRRQPRYRLLSLPAAAGALMALTCTVHGISWLTPRSLDDMGLSSALVKVLLRSFTNLSHVASIWLLALRGREMARLLRKLDRVLGMFGGRRSPKTARLDLMLLMVAAMILFQVVFSVWKIIDAGNPFAMTITPLPNIFMQVVEIPKMCRGLCLVAVLVFLMRICTEMFDSITDDIERLVHPADPSPRRPSPYSSEEIFGHLPSHNKTTPLPTAANPSGDLPRSLPDDLSVLSVDHLTEPRPPRPPVSTCHDLALLRARFTAAADVTAALGGVFALPTLLYLAHVTLISMLMMARMEVSVLSVDGLLSVGPVSGEAALGLTLLCQRGQRLEEAARRPVELLLRHPPQETAAAAEADRLVTLAQWLRPAAAAHGLFNINKQLLGSALAGYLTYLIVLVQMG